MNVCNMHLFRAMVCALIAIALVSIGCNKKKDQCDAVMPILATVREPLKVEVADDKNAKEGASAVGKLLNAINQAQRDLGAHPATDEELQPKVDKYNTALADLQKHSQALMAFLADVDATNQATAEREAATLAVVTSLMAYIHAAPDEQRATSDSTAGLAGGTPDDMEKMASIVESAKYKSADGRSAAAALAIALRNKAKILRATNDLDSKQVSIEKLSPVRHGTFGDARSEVQKADQAVIGVCSAK